MTSSKKGGAEQLLMFEQLFKKPEPNGEDLAVEEKKKEFEKGYAQARAEMQQQCTLLEKMIDKLLEEKKQLIDRMKPEVIDFCLQLTEQLLRQELSNATTLSKLIESLLIAMGRQRETISVVLAPEDLEMMATVISKMEGERQVYFCSDPTVRRGDVRIENSSILVNCTISRELESVRAHLLKGGL